MNDMRLEWDEQKNRKNKHKHKVSFEEAQTVFLDENAYAIMIQIIPNWKIASSCLA